MSWLLTLFIDKIIFAMLCLSCMIWKAARSISHLQRPYALFINNNHDSYDYLRQAPQKVFRRPGWGSLCDQQGGNSIWGSLISATQA